MSMQLRMKLMSPSEDMRWDAVWELSGRANEGDAGAGSLLIQALSDKSPRIRSSAAEGIASVRIPSVIQMAIEPLIRLLHDNDMFVRESSARALAGIGDKRAVPPLINALSDEYTGVRTLAAYGLGRIGDPQAIEPLKAAMNDSDEDVRKCAIVAVGKIRPIPLSAVVKPTESLRTPSLDNGLVRKVNSIAQEWEAGHTYESIIGSIADVLNSSIVGLPLGLILHVINAFYKHKNFRKVTSVLSRLKTDFHIDTGKLLEAAEQIDCMSDWSLYDRNDFLNLIDPQYAVIKPEIAKKVQDKQNVAKLIEQARSEVGTGSAPTFEKILALRDSYAVPGLCKGLLDNGTNAVYIRIDCARTLAEIADPSSIDALCAAMVDQAYPVTKSTLYDDVREWVAKALGRIGDPTTVGPLCEGAALAYYRDLGNTSGAQYVLRSVVNALEAIGPKGFDALCESAARRGDPVDDCLRETLNRFGDTGMEFAVSELKQRNPTRRVNAVVILGWWKDARAWAHLPGMLSDPDDEVKRVAAWQVKAHVNDLGEQVIEPLCQLLVTLDSTCNDGKGKEIYEAAASALFAVLKANPNYRQKVIDILSSSKSVIGANIARMYRAE
jgi:HEAT repeat protein